MFVRGKERERCVKGMKRKRGRNGNNGLIYRRIKKGKGEDVGG